MSWACASHFAVFVKKTTRKNGQGGGAADTIRLVVVSRVILDTNRNSSEL